MTELPETAARLTAVESRLEEVAADAAAARHLAAARDRDLADLGIKVEANRAVISGLGEQTAARFDRLESRFDGLEARFDGLELRFDGLEAQLHSGFAEMRGRFDQVAGGFEHIGGMLDELIQRKPPAG
jgi:hypothetical protein